VPCIYARKAAFDVSGAALEVKRDRDCGCGAKLLGNIGTLFSEPFEQDIPAEREASDEQWLVGILSNEPTHDEINVGRLAGVVHPPNPVHLTIAAAKDENICGPTAGKSEGERSLQVM
jgi:hypothetical protein